MKRVWSRYMCIVHYKIYRHARTRVNDFVAGSLFQGWLRRLALEADARQSILETTGLVLLSESFRELAGKHTRQTSGPKDLFERYTLLRPIHQ